MKKMIGFIGAGNMGAALIKGLAISQHYSPKQILVFDHNPEKGEQLAKTLDVICMTDVLELVSKVDILFLAVKPNAIGELLEQIKPVLNRNMIIVSIAAGVSLVTLESLMGTDKKIVRAMPNTPALVNAAMTSCTPNANVTANDLEELLTVLKQFGEVEVVPEKLIHAVVGVSGSAPAYIFMLIEAMADAGVLEGMPRKKAYRFAAQAVLGSAKMVLETQTHPGELKDAVCSPGGTTIEAVKTLEEKGFRAAIIDAVTACIEKSKKMG